STATGLAVFRQYAPDSEVRVRIEINGLEPLSFHGLHVHEFGDITDVTSGAKVGLHFNPLNVSHSCTEPRHAGDFGNIQADENGKV
ncbi:superoxide dismutase, partial [Zopfochytrium polystomum]